MTTVVRLPGVSDDEDRTLNLLLAQLDARMPRNKVRSAYYDMKRLVARISSVVPPQYFALGIVLGWAGKAVDILARRCNLDGFVWPDGDIDSIGYRDVWEGNNLAAEVGQGTVSSLIHASVFVVNTLGDERTGEPAGLLHFKDAMNATGEWNARARRLDNLLSVTGRDSGGAPNGLALYLDGLTIVAAKDASGWSVERQYHPWGVPAEVLPYKPRIGRPFGSSRISRAVMSLQDQATRTVVRMEAHSDIYAIPDLWLLGATEAIFKNSDGSQKASWEIVMGRIKALPDDPDADPQLARADVKPIPASSPQPHIDSLQQQAQLFSGETSIPLSSLGVSDTSNPVSADSYIASREDLIAEAEGSVDDWRPGLRRAFIRALAMQNGVTSVPPEWATIDTKWRSPVHLSRAAQADAGMKQITAAPWLAETEVGLELLGLSGQQIERALADKRRAQGRLSLDAIAAGVGSGTPA